MNLIDQFFQHPSAKYIVFSVLILLSAIVLSTALRKSLNLFLKKSSGSLNVDPTKFSFLKNGISFIIYTGALLTIMYTIPQLRSLGTTLFASAGIFAAILGFASQQAFSNIISGIFIVIFKPFRVGDVVEIGELYMGQVEDITLRHTVIRDFQNKRIIIPNSVISTETVRNSNIGDTKINKQIFFSISYDSNIEKATTIIREEAEKHPLCLDNRTEEEKQKGIPKVIIRLVNFGDSSVNLRANVWANDPFDAFEMTCDLNRSVKERFDKEGIEIPFPYRTLVFKNPLPKA